MSVEESYYNGLCVITCVVDKEADNGKTITVSNGAKSFTGTIANKKCIFKIPGKYPKVANTEYVITKFKSNGEIEFAKTVEVGYGDSITVHMDPGYEPLLDGGVLETIEEVEANTTPGNVPDALALKALYNTFAYDEDGIFGFHRKVDGADSVIPFKSLKLVGTVTNPQTYGQRPTTKREFTFEVPRGTKVEDIFVDIKEVYIFTAQNGAYATGQIKFNNFYNLSIDGTTLKVELPYSSYAHGGGSTNTQVYIADVYRLNV